MTARGSRQTASPIELLAQVLHSLPDQADRERLLKNLDAIINFFSDLKRRIESLPSTGDRARILAALEDIAGFLNRSRNDSVLASVLGLQYERGSRRSPGTIPVPSKSSDALLDELRALPTEEIQKRLNDYKQVTMSDLRAMAGRLGLKYEERMKRQELVDRIVKLGFANVRGYDLLRGRSTS